MLLEDIVLAFVVDVYIGSLNIGEAFELPLQGLRDVMSDL